ncbi:uncharacterized protein LOC142985568 [Anticarsia gemmatalis]|uniref:uncharacterized protein LOC142985568 n=1 Tax=Anticarsia gemmatalis TaxID=129554 RepID=UPI003F75D77D
MVTHPAPELSSIFDDILYNKHDYCYLCLRTSEETRLVHPVNFKQVVAAARIKTNLGTNKLCYICESQSLAALKVLRAATLAASVHIILNNLKQDYNGTKLSSLQYKDFYKLFMSCSLSLKLTPLAISKEISIIRNNTQLTVTDVVVMDNFEMQQTVQPLTTENVQLHNSILINHINDASDGSHAPEVIVPDTLNDVMELESQEEFCIISDDDNDNSTLSSSQPSPPLQLPLTDDLNTKLVVTWKPYPRIIPVNDFIKQQESGHNFILHPIFLNPQGYLIIPSLKATLHNKQLIFKDDSSQIIASHPFDVSTDVIKQNLALDKDVYLQTGEIPNLNTNISENTAELLNLNTNIAENTPESTNNKHRKPLTITLVISGSTKSGGKSDSCHNDVSNESCQSKNIKLKLPSNKKQVVNSNITISEISSDLDNVGETSKTIKTDWEDKIPKWVMVLLRR